MTLRSLLLWIVLAAAVAGCSGGEDGGSRTVTGVVVAVTGDESVESFVVRDLEGSSLQFAPSNAASFRIEDLRALVLAQDEVTVVFEQPDDGTYVAVSIDVAD